MKKVLMNTGLWLGYFIGSQIGMAFLFVGQDIDKMPDIPPALIPTAVAICGVIGLVYLTGFTYLYWKNIYVKPQSEIRLPKPWMSNPLFPLAFYLVFLVAEFFLPVEPTANQISVEAFILNQPFFAFCAVVIFAPLMEELLFSMVHGPSTLPQFLIYFTMGICLTWIYLAKRDIRYAMGLHALNNLLSFVLIIL